MCHFYNFRQSAPKPSVGIISHLCHYATCILQRLGNFIKRILVCCFEAGKLHSNFGNERKLKCKEIFRVMWKKLRPNQKGLRRKTHWFRSQCIRWLFIRNKLKKGCTVPPLSKHSHGSEKPNEKRSFLLHLPKNQAHSSCLGPILASQLSLPSLPKTSVFSWSP